MPAAAAPYLFPAGARFFEDNLVLAARSRRHRADSVAGPTSIKTVVSGEVLWKLSRREILVDSNSFLVLRAGEVYSLHIDESAPVETCCVFFEEGLAEGVLRDATRPLAEALDDPGALSPPLEFLSSLHPDPGRELCGRVQQLARRCRGELAPSAAEEAFVEVASALLVYYQEVRRQMARLTAARAATREELYRRLLLAREFLHGHARGSVSLKDAARAACLSPYHFHRSFGQAFGATPHEYLTGLRLGRARELLVAGHPVTEVCLEVGFSSLPTFSRRFRARFGCAPSQIRKIGSALARQA